jgi:Spy/CpxP family protein refolding chaperone
MMNKSGKGVMGILAATVIGAAVAGLAFADYQAGPRGPMMGGGYGPGMMGGYGMGQGMMGQGYGSGMMGGYGMGPGMMGMHEGLPGIALDDKQRKQFNAIQDELRRKRWELMGRTMDEQAKLRDLYEADKRDPAAIGAAYQRVFDLRRQIIEATVAAHNRIEALLTPEQRQAAREHWGRSWRGRTMGP